MNNKIELLAPAGNMASLKAAVAGGCDAVYLGLQTFSARAFAGNFSHDEYLEAIAYCHIRDVKIYVTLNTMLYETEIENAKKEVAFLYDHDVDGLLIQDLGLFHYVRTCYPDLDIHCSTQMHIHNLAGVKFMQSQGAKRVVLARETPLEIIQQACRTGIPIEVFVYGAICISYSGQCLMSAVTKDRSANKGMCAQCCRLKYYPDGRKAEEGEYVLSPKDLNAIDHVPELIAAGVSSLKIEGRMKRPEYVYLVTRTFREAIDAYYAGKKYQVNAERMQDLLLMFNRGFSEGHLFHADTKERMSQYRPNHQGIEIGTVLQFRHGRVQVKLNRPLHQHDGLRILNEPNDTGLTAVKIYDEKENLVNHGDPGQIVWLECHDRPEPKKGQKLHKTSDALLLKQIDSDILAPDHRIPVTMQYQAVAGQPFHLQISDGMHALEVQSEQCCETAKNAPLGKDKIEASLQKIGDAPYCLTKVEGCSENIFLPVSVINEVRRNALAELSSRRAKCHERMGKQPYTVVLTRPQPPLEKHLCVVEEVRGNGCDNAVYTEGYGPHQIRPVVNQDYTEYIDGEDAILSSYCDLGGHHHTCIAGMTLNIANSYAMAYVTMLGGIDGIVVSSEMSQENLAYAIKAFADRYGFTPYLYPFVYGSRTVMYIKDGFLSEPASYLKDVQGNRYFLRSNRGTVEIKEPEIQHRKYTECYGDLSVFGSWKEYEAKRGDQK